MINKKTHTKQERIAYLLKRMETEPMNIHKMAEVINMSVKSISKYLTELKIKKKVHIHKYERTIGQYAVFYMTGNRPDAMKPIPYSQKEYNQKSKQRAKKANMIKKHRDKVIAKELGNFVPRPDYAAHWMFNPC